ncbi:chemoreceptor glutamine deamidase CheD [Chitinolyticbacter meiyuanensis]|uniref:chemoreceptor glutamine deamidase CheD n=1 Tax=Chitinolyticbacter meiyuanensis TaxID=682798 RepID=UPI0011E5C388|nr:chemoreceptor glutamine deamidase CheD [Chitinolyticbacter meiyuanensis]
MAKQRDAELPTEPRRYHDHRFGLDAVKLLPSHYFATQENVVLVTVLGSCVAVCLRDPLAKVGGMNHFMLPDGEDGLVGAPARYGTNAMELLINRMMKLGARRSRLEAKVFGAAAVVAGIASWRVGERNAEFVQHYLATEGIRVLAEDLRGQQGRKLYFFPATGRVLVRRLKQLGNQTLFERENAYSRALSKPRGGDVDLF